MALVELINKWITERGSADVLLKHLAFTRDQIAPLEKKIAELTQENEKLKNEMALTRANLRRATRPDDYVMHRSVLFKKKSAGGFEAAVFCPTCKVIMGSAMGELPYRCPSCKLIVDFTAHDLPQIMASLPLEEEG